MIVFAGYLLLLFLVSSKPLHFLNKPDLFFQKWDKTNLFALKYCYCFYAVHQHHHVVPLAQIPLTLSRHFSLSFITSGRSSGLHPVSSHSCCMFERVVLLLLGHMRGVHRSTSLITSSLLLQQCPACLVRLAWIVFVMGGRWPFSWCLMRCCCEHLLNKSWRHSCVIAV